LKVVFDKISIMLLDICLGDDYEELYVIIDNIVLRVR